MGRLLEAVVRATYRGTMGVAAGALEVGRRLPLLPPRLRAHADRLGYLDAPDQAAASGTAAVWVHAASLGELTGVRPLVRELRARVPGRQVIVSTMTRTGLAMARALDEAHLALLLPLDAPRVVERVLEPLDLEAFLFTETEIWPTWLEALRARRIPTIMVSGRVGERTARRARWLRPLYGPALVEVTCCMQTAADAERVVALGADPRRVQVAGSLKFDVEAVASGASRAARLASWLEATSRRLIVCGSTHAGEERMLLEAYARLAPRHPDAAMLLAPRHPERFEEVAALVEERGLPLTRFSSLVDGGPAASSGAPAIVLLDEMGVLASCYPLAVAAFVGGSLVPVGGHNVLEPAQAGIAVLVGPHTETARDTVEPLVTAGGAMRVGSVADLEGSFDQLLGEPGLAAAMGLRARRAGRAGEGAVERHLKVIAARLSAASFKRRIEE
jgi:3-deoxy-D-manno-octulosonic-acid transferase